MENLQNGLERFLDAQKDKYDTALNEIHAGAKETHWMWFVFPQIKGLGMSPIAQHYGVDGLDEAKAYLANPTLRSRLLESSEALLKLDGNDAEAILGHPDNLKLKSSMTLFAMAESTCLTFQAVLDKFFDGQPDKATLGIIERMSAPQIDGNNPPIKSDIPNPR